MYDIADLSFLPRHEELLILYSFTQLLFGSFISRFVKNEVSKHLFILKILLLIELKQILFPFQVFFELIYFFLEHVFSIFNLEGLISFDLFADQEFGWEWVPIMIEIINQ